MTGEEWNSVKELFHSAVQLAPEERTRFLETQTFPPVVMEEVRALLAVYDTSPEFLEDAAAAMRGQVLPEAMRLNLAGRRIGAWELIREVGRGGMGVVWEARRADEQYQQRAAVKLLPVSLLSEHAVARFRDERQILAGLNHPNIARLIDGGTLEDGSPYLVMEYVDGPPIDTWCDKQGLGVRERLALFLAVCGAVEYAHRHLVIHRDLKPLNILVTADGAPKLLDFGIAKLIEAEGAPARTETRVLTPDFASPEQLQGRLITTATDVFSLGVLLYVLLTGSRPFTAPEGDSLGVMRAVVENEPARPSTVAPNEALRVTAELDAIVLQALQKAPEERYSSVRALADDVRAWLEGRDVIAAPQPWWRRSVRLIRRHKTQSAAIAAAALSLVAGTGISLWQAGVARRQSERAERRFQDVRKFSESVLFELHRAIRDLPGSTPARNLLLQRATEFLDDLAKDPAADTALKAELAKGYNQLGHVQGQGYDANLGHRDAALESFRKSARLGEAVWAESHSRDTAIGLLDTYQVLAMGYLDKNNPAEAEVWHNRERDLSTAIEARYPRDLTVGLAVAESYSERGLYRVQRNDFAKAKELYRQALDRYTDLDRRGLHSGDFYGHYAFASKRLGAILIVEHSLGEAEARYRTALAMEDRLLASASQDPTILLDRSFTLSDLALILGRKGDFAGSAAMYEEVLHTRQAAAEKDPHNMRLVRLSASAAERLARAYSNLGRHHEAIQLAWQAVRWRDLDAATTHDHAERVAAAESRVNLASRITDGAHDPHFAAGAGEHIADARTAVEQAGALVPQAQSGQAMSPSDREFQADYLEIRHSLFPPAK